jgi:ABC-2 type transport system permease protein
MYIFYNELSKQTMKHLISKKNRSLLSELVRTDFKLRYQGSVLGYAWSLLRPLLLFLILYVVFVKFMKIGDAVKHYPVYLLLGIVMWNFFSEMTSQSATSIVGRGDLIRKISIPRWIIVISSSLSASINLFLNLIVVAILAAINHVEPSVNMIMIIPALIFLYIFSLGISFFLAAAYVKYRDINYIWEVLLQAGFYLTPILYPLSMIPNLTFQKLILLNPAAMAMQDARYAVIGSETVTTKSIFDGGPYWLIPVVIVIITSVIGALYFKKESKYFAENI